MEEKIVEIFTVEPCASSKACEVLLKGRKIDLAKANAGEVLARTPVVVVSKFEGLAISIYASGRIMIKNAGAKEAQGVARRIVSLLEKSGAIHED